MDPLKSNRFSPILSTTYPQTAQSPLLPTPISPHSLGFKHPHPPPNPPPFPRTYLSPSHSWTSHAGPSSSRWQRIPPQAYRYFCPCIMGFVSAIRSVFITWGRVSWVIGGWVRWFRGVWAEEWGGEGGFRGGGRPGVILRGAVILVIGLGWRGRFWTWFVLWL